MILSIKEIAFKEQARMDGLRSGLITGMFTYILLFGYNSVTIMSPVGGGFFHSLTGVMLLPAIIIALIISLKASEETIEKRMAAEVEPMLKLKDSRIKKAVSVSLIHAGISILILVSIGWIISRIYPDLALSQLEAALVAFIFAFGIAYIESISSILRTFKKNQM